MQSDNEIFDDVMLSSIEIYEVITQHYQSTNKDVSNIVAVLAATLGIAISKAAVREISKQNKSDEELKKIGFSICVETSDHIWNLILGRMIAIRRKYKFGRHDTPQTQKETVDA